MASNVERDVRGQTRRAKSRARDLCERAAVARATAEEIGAHSLVMRSARFAPLQIALRPATNVVYLRGELDLATAPTATAVLNDCVGPVVFDCSDLTFVDAAGLHMFEAAHQTHGATLLHLSKWCRRVVDLTGLTYLVVPEER